MAPPVPYANGSRCRNGVSGLSGINRYAAPAVDSAGRSYSSVSDGSTTRLEDIAGHVVATWTYDSLHRIQRVDIIGTIVIEYVYDATFDWREKIIRQPNGQIIKRFPRRD